MNRRGIALISVLVVLMALAAIVAAGLQLGVGGVLQVSVAHKRNVALAAAEAGVYEAMRKIAGDKAFSGQGYGDLSESHAHYRFKVDNDLPKGGTAKVLATGSFGGVERTLEAYLEPDTDGFDAIGIKGRQYNYDRIYVNGISSSFNPTYEPGGAYSGYGVMGENSFVAGAADSSVGLRQGDLWVTGDLVAASKIDGTFMSSPHIREKKESTTKTTYHLDRGAILNPPPPSGSPPTDGHFKASVRIDGTGSLVFSQKVTIDEGVVVHITGSDVLFRQGIEGKGSLVVDQNIIIRANGNFDHKNNEGLKILSDQSVVVANPKVTIDSSGLTFDQSPESRVGDFFAGMPPQAPDEIAQSIPVDAKHGADFFYWYDSQLSSGGNAGFDLWYNGNGTEVYPGLSGATKEWLEQGRLLKGDIKAWAGS